MFVELDVGSEGNGDEAQIGAVLRSVVTAGSIASYVTSPVGFQFRRLGAGERGGGLGTPITSPQGAACQRASSPSLSPMPYGGCASPELWGPPVPTTALPLQ